MGQVVDNAGKLRVKGIEGDFNWRMGAFTLRGAAAYNHARYQNYVGQCYPGQTIAQGCSLIAAPGGAFTSQDYDGRTPPKAPRFSGRIGFALDLPLGDGGWALQTNGDLSYSSSCNFFDTLRPDSVQDAFAKIDAALRLTSPDERWSFGIIGRNLTNELVVTAANDIPFAGSTGTGTAGPGVLDAPEVLADERFATRGLRAGNLALLYREMARLTPPFTTADLLAHCHAAQIPAQPVRDLGAIMDDPHLAATGFLTRLDHPTEGACFAMQHPVKFTPPLGVTDRPAPTQGQNGPDTAADGETRR